MLVIAIAGVLTGCPEPATPTPPTPDADIFDGEGVTWDWGTPSCSAQLSAPGEPPITTSVIWRDTQGRIVLAESCVGTACRRTSRVGFDRQGRRVISDVEGNPTHRWTYDAHDRIATQHTRYSDGDAWITYDRDADGHLLEATTVPVGGGVPFIQRYTRDAAGRLIAYFASSANGVVSDATFTRDAAGHPITGRILGDRDGAPIYLNVVFEWDGDRYSHVHARYDDASWDLDSYYTWDAAGELIAITDEDEAFGHVGTLEIERSARGVTNARQTNHDGVTSWESHYDRTPGRVVRTQDFATDPPQHLEDTLVDTCPTDPPPEPAWAVSFEPAWPSPWLPYDPDVSDVSSGK